MTHFGIICPSSTGPLNTMLPLGQELQRRGHRVTVIGILDARPKVLVAGLEFQVVGEDEFPEGAMAESFAQLGKLSGLAALAYTINLLKNLATVTLRDAPDLLQASNVEALLVNQGSREGGTVADFLGIPFVTVCSAVVLNREPSVPPFNTLWQYSPAWWARLRNRAGYALLNRVARPTRTVIQEYRREWKLPLHAHPNDAYSRLAQISQAPAEFEFPREKLPSWFHFTGSYHSSASREPVPFPYENLTEKPLIYASMGTLQNRLIGIFQQIASACEGLDAQLVISLGGSARPESLPKLPGNPVVVEYAPQLEILKKATLMITHAGMNTTMECLKYGVPMVAIPVTNDQPGVAARIAWTGVGEYVPLSRLNVPKLKAAIQKVFTENSYKQNAARLQQAIQKAGGVTRAADIIEQAISTGKPVLANVS
ncbi:glycosyltransferase [Chroococcidiopsis thermalis]|uniref:Glycosyltransferase, MGT family n=1 Tax=Chroococcidiopsis thermalis (strain PCC 7203) TaxID=251229 RepID=K9TZ99_CHRTP|nr:glycosyltransferase [Chroococcidiopsis thermalis]AFY87299.1 glycosyltransferase, MGT family [Chroococcidiopsis thermalis PCC 7203]PSB44164.1 glycosyl transferase family 1 [Cyanosarcina cf. burmensis CCALA 770]